MNATAGLQYWQWDTVFAFPDGNAIIVALNVFFQIHQSVLALHCPALAAQLARSAETMHGRPVLRVADTPNDIRAILHVVYGMDKHSRSAPEPISILFGWLRVGTKYDMKKLVARAIDELNPLFPAKLSQWDKRHGPESRHGFRDKDAIEALNLFQQTGRFSLIPAAVYRCCQLDPAVVQNGTTRADGTPEWLSPANLALIARAKELLKEQGAEMIEECEEEFEQSGGCAFAWALSDPCIEVMHDLKHTADDGKKAWSGGDPLDHRFLDYIHEQRDTGPGGYESRGEFADCMGACAVCIRQARQAVAGARARVWADLPAIAGVEDKVGHWA
ncbi:hypothetical protein C8T65DRAFT_737574 [Cerioporus squamosus]|nr:hypothetical protein C8T65DRAFT_737574 [Cerioporus squamosus]